MSAEGQAAAVGAARLAGVISTLLALSYPLLSHASVALHQPLLQWLALSSFAAVPLVPGLLALRFRSWLIFVLISVALWALTQLGGGQLALYLPPLVFTATLAATFGLSLRAGRTPLISTFARIARGGALPEPLVHYTRKLTIFWTLMLAVLFTISLWLTFVGPLWLWSWHTNFFSYAVLTVVFVGEFFLRRYSHPEETHIGFFDYIRLMARIRGGQLK